jgi:hypothetical protein
MRNVSSNLKPRIVHYVQSKIFATIYLKNRSFPIDLFSNLREVLKPRLNVGKPLFSNGKIVEG